MPLSSKNVWLSFVLGITVGLAIFFLFSPPPPSYSIAVLGVVAVVMTLVPPREPSKGEKAVWITVAFLLMVVEMVAIHHDRQQQDSQFQTITAGLQTSIDGIKATLQETNANLKITQQVGKLAQQNLEEVTGGDSYAYVTPQMGVNPIPLTIYNYGTNTLTGVLVDILPPTEGLENFVNAVMNPVEVQVGTLHPGTFGTTGPRFLKGYFINIHTITKGVQYQIHIYSQNFTVTQYLFFKPGKHHLLYSTQVEKQYVKSKVGDTIYYGYQMLFKSDWSKDD